MFNDGSIDDMIEGINKLNVHEAVGQALKNTKQEIVEYQRSQFLRGFRSDGQRIGKYKNDAYARAKYNRFNPLAGFGFVDLRYTGDYYAGIVALIGSDDVIITSNDSKFQDIAAKYDANDTLFGLNEDFTADYVDVYLEPEANKIIQNELH